MVVNGMIAEHNSQELLQTMCDRDRTEYLWIDYAGAPRATIVARKIFTALSASPSEKQTFQQSRARN
jgi:hypothetical protein